MYSTCSVLPRNNYKHVDYVCTYVCAYVHHHYIIRTHTVHHKLLAASVVGNNMICTKHRFSIITECMLVISYK